MRTWDAFRAWGRILTGYRPILSIEITKACPLSCPGCYAYQPDHVSGTSLASMAEYKGQELIEGVLSLVERRRPLVVYFVGGEPLLKARELGEILPRVCGQGVEVRVVTSAVRAIPREWAQIPRFGLSVSVDGLPAEHDVRRQPATYERILRNIEGHRIVVHCTVTRPMTEREGYLEEFVQFWSDRPEVTGIHVSLFTPQVGEESPEILTPPLRRRVAEELDALRPRYPKLTVRVPLSSFYLDPPRNPTECIFARTSEVYSADLETKVTPCQLGGRPNWKG